MIKKTLKVEAAQPLASIVVDEVFNPLMGDHVPNSIELGFVVRGRLRVNYANGEAVVNAGYWYMARGHKSLSLRADRGGDSLLLHRLRFSEDFLPPQLLRQPQCASLRVLMNRLHKGLYVEDDESYMPVWKSMHELHGLDGVSQVAGLLALCDRLSGMNVKYISPIGTNVFDAPHRDSVVRDIDAYIVGNIGRHISLAELGRIASLTETSLCRYYKQAVGISPAGRILELRIAHACHLLDTTSLTVREIAFRCGYSDPSFFSTAFHRTIGQTPKAYRMRFDR